jgi:uncharacterized RDD family membrane protein YckC
MVDFAYRTLPSRIMAGIADGFFCWGVDALLTPLLSAFGGGELLAGILLGLLWVIYDITMTVRYGGTLGKLLFWIRIYHVSETSYLSVTQAFIRESVGLALWAIGIGVSVYETASAEPLDVQASIRLMDWLTYANLSWSVLEILTALFSRKRRAIHDFMASSVVKRTWGGKTAARPATADPVLVDGPAR